MGCCHIGQTKSASHISCNSCYFSRIRRPHRPQ